jgi:hypothetical protein
MLTQKEGMTMKTTFGFLFSVLLVVAFGIILQPPSGFAVVVGQVDAFEGGTTQNWTVGLRGGVPPFPPVVVTGGPAGLGDHFMRVTASGSGVDPGSRLAVINLVQWAGNYTASGITAITMDVNNLGSTVLNLRLLISDATNFQQPEFPPANTAISAAPVIVPPGSGWVSVAFPITVENLVAVTGSVNTALASATQLRIFHNPAPVFPPPIVQAQLGVDNITAFAPPAIPTRFSDVPTTHFAYAQVDAIAASGITTGCQLDNPGTPQNEARFCPESSITRAQMAVFIETSLGNPPNTCTGQFSDVPSNNPFCGFIERLAADGITDGCTPTQFCPDDPVTRGQMAVFIETALRNPTNPYAGLFGDVSADHPFCGFIERLASDGITGGCGGGNFCPDAPVTRAQMAVFLVAAPLPLNP